MYFDDASLYLVSRNSLSWFLSLNMTFKMLSFNSNMGLGSSTVSIVNISSTKR